VADRVCTIPIENEGKRNAMGFEMADVVVATIRALEERDERIVVLVRGAGEQAFSAGLDLTVDRTSRSADEKRVWPKMVEARPVAVRARRPVALERGLQAARLAVTPARIGPNT
jgi:enoyl-CoA hydratase/carnithine racemase